MKVTEGPHNSMRSSQLGLLSTAVFIAYIASHFPVYRHDESLLGSALESLAVAHSIAFHGTFANPFDSLPTGPTAGLAPVYPVSLGVILRLWGEGATAAYAVKWFTTCVAGIQAALLPALSVRMRLGYLPGLIAALAFTVGGYQATLWEANLAGVIILLLSFAMYAAYEHHLRWTEIISTGVLAGITFLVSPVPLLVVLIWLVLLRVDRKLEPHKIAVMFLVALSIIAPWTVRNKLVLGHVFFVRDNLGIEIWRNNNDCAEYSFRLSQMEHCYPGPNSYVSEAEQVREMGEVEYGGLKLRQATAWIRANRSRFAKLTVLRVGSWWFPTETARWRDLTIGEVIASAMTLFSVFGLVGLWKVNRDACKLLLVWMLVFPVVYYPVGHQDRYRYPVLWATFIPGSYFLLKLLEALPMISLRSGRIRRIVSTATKVG